MWSPCRLRSEKSKLVNFKPIYTDRSAYLRHETLWSHFIFHAIDFTIIADVLVPSFATGSALIFARSFAGFLCENTIFGFKADDNKRDSRKVRKEDLTINNTRTVDGSHSRFYRRHLQIVVFLLLFVLFLANDFPFAFIVVSCTWSSWGWWLWIINNRTFLAGDGNGASGTIFTTKRRCIKDVNGCLITVFYGGFNQRWWQFTVKLFLRIAQGFWCMFGETICQWNLGCRDVVSLYIRVQCTTTTYLLVAAKVEKENWFLLKCEKNTQKNGETLWATTGEQQSFPYFKSRKILVVSDPILIGDYNSNKKANTNKTKKESDNKIQNLTLILFKASDSQENDSGPLRDSISDFGA